MGTVTPNKDTYFICPRCGTSYRYITEPAVDVLAHLAGGNNAGSNNGCSCCEKHAHAPTCDYCGTAMLVTNCEDVVIFIRDALRKIWEGETA